MKLVKNQKSIEVKYCRNLFSRFKGFMFKKNIDCCLCFPKCNSIHTIFMIKSINVIMTDKDYNILYIYKKLKPFRIILPKKDVYYTFELPINSFNFNIGEKIKIK